MKKKLPIGISSLREIIYGDYIYVDKTFFVHELVNTGKYYFLSRPRRFGKSLFVDTLKEAFEGNKELFQGLYIYDKWNWEVKYPVIHISFAEKVFHSRKELEEEMIEILKLNMVNLGVNCENLKNPASCFRELIRNVKEKYQQNVVILIDEYDKPILDNITNIEIAREMREGLKNFYSVIKGQDANIKFVFMTGVSKFSKVSIFSGLNNLRDITINKKYSSICGYTEEDLIKYFSEYLLDKNIDDIRYWYNGYSWTGNERVYNPFSILNYLEDGEFKNYWFESATPTFLIELLKEKKYYIPQLETLETDESLIGTFDIDFIEPENLLFQAGYLTIENYHQDYGEIWYKLTYPNKEVKVSLNNYILKHYSYSSQETINRKKNLKEYLEKKDIEKIKELMESHFASIPSDWYRKNDIDHYEGYYASVFYSYFASLGLDIRCEDTTNYGKIDMVVLMKHAIFIFEFKVIKSQEEIGQALKQIKEKNYIEKYKSNNVSIFLVGIEFDKDKRNIIGYEWELG